MKPRTDPDDSRPGVVRGWAVPNRRASSCSGQQIAADSPGKAPRCKRGLRGKIGRTAAGQIEWPLRYDANCRQRCVLVANRFGLQSRVHTRRALESCFCSKCEARDSGSSPPTAFQPRGFGRSGATTLRTLGISNRTSSNGASQDGIFGVPASSTLRGP